MCVCLLFCLIERCFCPKPALFPARTHAFGGNDGSVYARGHGWGEKGGSVYARGPGRGEKGGSVYARMGSWIAEGVPEYARDAGTGFYEPG